MLKNENVWVGGILSPRSRLATREAPLPPGRGALGIWFDNTYVAPPPKIIGPGLFLGWVSNSGWQPVGNLLPPESPLGIPKPLDCGLLWAFVGLIRGDLAPRLRKN